MAPSLKLTEIPENFPTDYTYKIRDDRVMVLEITDEDSARVSYSAAIYGCTILINEQSLTTQTYCYKQKILLLYLSEFYLIVPILSGMVRQI